MTVTHRSIIFNLLRQPHAGQAVSDELPKLFSDEELGVLRRQRAKADNSANDIRGEGKIRPEHLPTDGLPESLLEQKFPHIAQKLSLLWGSDACAHYIGNLAIIDRGDRHGFPVDVLEDLMMLSEINAMLTEQSGSNRASAAPDDWPEAVSRPRD